MGRGEPSGNLSCGGRRPTSGERQSRRRSGRGQRESGPSTPRNGFVSGRVRRPHFPYHRWQGRIDCQAVPIPPLADSYSANPSPAAPARAFALEANAYLMRTPLSTDGHASTPPQPLLAFSPLSHLNPARSEHQRNLTSSCHRRTLARPVRRRHQNFAVEILSRSPDSLFPFAARPATSHKQAFQRLVTRQDSSSGLGLSHGTCSPNLLLVWTRVQVALSASRSTHHRGHSTPG